MSALIPEAAGNPATERTSWRWPALAALVLAVGLLAALAAGFFVQATRVRVRVDGLATTVYTHADTVGSLLDEMQLALRPEDVLQPARSTPLAGDAAIAIRRARPLILEIEGGARRWRTQAQTVAAALAEQDLALGEHDVLTLDGHGAAAADSLAAPRLDAGRTLPGLPAVYPWRGTEPPTAVLSLRRAARLTVQIGSVQWSAWTIASTVGEALAERQIVIYEGDRVEPALGEPVRTGIRVRIERSMPVVLTTAGHQLPTRSRARTVAGLLAENGLMLSGQDRVEPALDTPLQPELAVRITRVEHVFEIAEQVTPYESIWQADAELEIDNEQLEQEGVNGITRQRYRIVLEDGQPITRTLEDTWLAQAPVTRVFTYGAKIVLRQLDTPAGVVTYWRKVRMFATSYTAADAGTPRSSPWYGRTRTGMQAGYGVVAVDPAVVSLYTELYVPGYGQAVAGDTGSGVKGRWIDLGYPDGQAAGWSRCVEVYLLGPPPPSYAITYRLPNRPAVSCLNR